MTPGYFGFFLCLLGVILGLYKKNVLSLLLTLECIVVLSFIQLTSNEIYFRVYFIRVGACESAVGLGALVGLIRLTGSHLISISE